MTIKQATPARVVAFATLVLSLGALIAVALLSAPRADAVPASKASSLWNKQRKLNGIPAGLVNRDALNDGCRKHNNYMATNNELTHFEDNTKPAYTFEGDAAGQSSVLGVGSPPWNTLNRNPWENAPIHLSQMLDPTLKFTGYDESQGYECATTLARYRQGYGARPAPPKSKLFTYPGPGTTIYRGMHPRESPFTPGDLVGIPQGKLTGPHLYVLIFPGQGINDYSETADITRATLKSPSGRKLGVAVVDETNDQIANYIPAGGIIIPRRALKAGRKYTAHVEVTYAGQTLRRTWRFRTSRRVLG
jgi:hypothetical protein